MFEELWFHEIWRASDRIRNCALDLSDIASALFRVGNKEMGGELMEMAQEIVTSIKKIRDCVGGCIPRLQ
jgi:hypothetical protein